jgi:hypothetical protein
MQKIKIDSGAFWAALALLSNDCYWFHVYPLPMIVSALIGTSAPFSHCHVGNHSCVAFNSVPHSVHAPPIFALPGVDYTIPITRELWNGDELLARCSKKNGRYYLYMRDSSSLLSTVRSHNHRLPPLHYIVFSIPLSTYQLLLVFLLRPLLTASSPSNFNPTIYIPFL